VTVLPDGPELAATTETGQYTIDAALRPPPKPNPSQTSTIDAVQRLPPKPNPCPARPVDAIPRPPPDPDPHAEVDQVMAYPDDEAEEDEDDEYGENDGDDDDNHPNVNEKLLLRNLKS